MQRIKALGLALVAVLALSGAAVSSASASSFLAHPAGGIKGSNTNTHIFKVTGGKVECETVGISGTATALKSLHVLVRVDYSNCTAFGFAEVQISHALYLFSADLKVSLENTVTINVPLGFCSLTVAPAKNQNLDAVHYANNANGTIRVNALVKKITYTSSGGVCGASGENGEYNGEATVESTVAGGVLRWDKE